MTHLKHTLFTLLFIVGFGTAKAEDTTTVYTGNDTIQFQALLYDTTGKIDIGSGLANFQIPKGFKYLNAKQSEYVLTTLWGNPPSTSLGMIFPDETSDLMPDNLGHRNIV